MHYHCNAITLRALAQVMPAMTSNSPFPDMNTDSKITFNDLCLDDVLLKALDDVGYETPTPIQEKTIPLMLQGRDVLGQAHTGTGKTAAFALPVLSKLNFRSKKPGTMVLVPTRELAIQVAEAFQAYAVHIRGFHVLPVYGGQDYRGQIKALERGIHVVVGTPGRIMDHMRRGTLDLAELKTLVLDEADEMLRMGFIDDVEWILEKTPAHRQIALFSATIPHPIRKIANRYLDNPEEITIKVKTTTADTIRQRYWSVTGSHKLDALTRILEAETFDGMIVFVRTKTATVDLSEKLEARGFASAPLNGDIPQNQRERTVEQLKSGKLDILVATDVAARGLDVDRISHVINYDIPYDPEAYVHRVGRTGRAGRQGDAILFVAPRERHMLHAIEKSTRKKIELMDIPTNDLINERRISRFKQRITDTLEGEDLKLFSRLIEEYQQESDKPVVEIAAALAQLLQGNSPFLLQKKAQLKSGTDQNKDRNQSRNRDHAQKSSGRDKSPRHRTNSRSEDAGTVRFRIEVGNNHNVGPSNIVGAIANETGLDSRFIGRLEIFDDHSLVDLPEDIPRAMLKILGSVWVSGQKLKISRLKEQRPGGKSVGRRAANKATQAHPKRPASRSKTRPGAKRGRQGSG